MTWVLGDGPYKGRPSHLLTEMNNILRGNGNDRLANVKLTDVEVDPYCGDAIVHASEEDVDLLVSLSHLWVDPLERVGEIELQSKSGVVKKTSKHQKDHTPASANAVFRIRWHCADPPFSGYEGRGITRTHIWEMLHKALEQSGSPSLAAISFDGVDVKWNSGDVDVTSTHRDRDRAVKYAHLWFLYLDQGEAAVIPGIYAPQSQTAGKEPGRRKSDASKRNLEDPSGSQTNLSRSLSKSARRKRQKIRSQQRKQEEEENQAPYMQAVASRQAM
ncbi:uncharacterized protein N7477_005784 [Penicillium maclennaniae]|uniref:uncharacterized protein n=1 Tax=Penicillium maclennaniae TaxID=1343394 RepID=UPI0025424D06|nr:uncharacterized protein N7477_005784 [Penicillium maclennaniae]KAJ5670421.1 hypothetical protein N7477_005784 [Penicillium maclennaniae]